jgi:hypothetical protein
MAAIIAYCLSGAIALSILLIAARLLFVPHLAAAGFGVAVRPDPRWDACPSTKVGSRHRIRSVHGDPDSQSGCSLAWLVHAGSDTHCLPTPQSSSGTARQGPSPLAFMAQPLQ